MDFAKDTTSASSLEIVVLIALVLVVAVVAWRVYARASGRDVSDVQGLHFTKRPPTPPS